MKLGRYWWIPAGILLLVSTGVSLALPRGFALTAYGDSVALLLFLTATLVVIRNAVTSTGQTRAFWALLGAGFLLWTANHLWWSWYELILKRPLPDPFAGDIVLFLHLVPFIAAVALRPHRIQGQEKFYLSTLNFLTLLAWWVFLYAFVIFPDEYVLTNIPVYTGNYDLLYTTENSIFVLALATAFWRSQGAWRRVYANLCGAALAYTIASEILNAAITRGKYHSGSLYDILLFAALCWFIWAVIDGGRADLQPMGRADKPSRWVTMAPRLAMVAILSLPTLGLWVVFFDHSAPVVHRVRLLVSLLAMLVLGAFVFLKQYLLNHQLLRLVESTDASYRNLHRLQTELVQKEKLASLGRLIAGAAHEINDPVTAILGYSELLSSDPTLPPRQGSMAHKIGQQARRTRDLVSDLLSFAQQTPGEKSPIDIAMVLQRAVQVEVPALDSRKIHVDVKIAPSLPPVFGNAQQLLQAFAQILSNALDALEEVGGGTITVTAQPVAGHILLEFSDSGPGIQDTQRVFDPFYTTKPIGKGTGLGLSATYGVIQNHGGQITCRNRPGGGAVFSVLLPYTSATPVSFEAAHV